MTADLALDDFAASFGMIDQNPHIMRVAVPRPRNDLSQKISFQSSGRNKLQARWRVEWLGGRINLCRPRGVAPRRRQRHNVRVLGTGVLHEEV